MTIKHHPDIATLMSFAAGTLHEALAAAVAAHVEMCPACQKELRLMEQVGAAFVAASEPVALLQPATAFPASPAPASPGSARSEPKAEKGDAKAGPALPGAVRELLRRADPDAPQKDALRWRFLAPGIQYIPLPLSEGVPGDLRLLKIAPGKKMPEHGHGGTELTLILEGSYHDGIGHYCSGDMSDYDEDVEHRPVVDPDEPCICLVASEQPAAFKGVVGRLLQPLVGM